MSAWKSKIDNYLEEQKRIEDAEADRRREEREREYQDKLEVHRKRFKCHVCGEPSKGPYLQDTSSWDAPHGPIIEHWQTPTGLTKCNMCGKWVCEDCNHKGICERCAEKL